MMGTHFQKNNLIIEDGQILELIPSMVRSLGFNYKIFLHFCIH